MHCNALSQWNKRFKVFFKTSRCVSCCFRITRVCRQFLYKRRGCLVDVGINRIEIDGKSKIVGDVNQDSVTGIAVR
ncbi:MAG: hypothetical protein Ct9H90mP15_09510 [Candidatus Neomarinimicrobiota bacterium]|nr:MAG: hypothetical protein Ct9H90mP15_09510 [Candidatus Neomarinimicrobiota bacterium]